MKLLRKITVLFLLCSGLAAACPDQKLHNGVEKYIKESSALKKQGKKLVLNSEKFVMGVYLAVQGDQDRLEDAMATVMTKIITYSQNHNYNLVIVDAEGNEKEFMEFIGK